jgi:hypothetical protein
MPIIRYLGKITPTDVNVTLASIPYGTSNHLHFGLECKWELRIVDSSVAVALELNKFDLDQHLQPTINFAQDIAKIAASLLSLQHGIAFELILEKLILPNGEMKWVYCKEQEFPKYMTAIHKQEGFNQAIVLAISNHTLSMILRDITDGLRSNYQGVIGAARAMDGICNHFVPDGMTRKDGWPLMQKALNASENYIKSITRRSEGPRHANWDDYSAEKENREAAERAWILVNRFLEYRKRGDQPLPSSDFPFLELSQV